MGQKNIMAALLAALLLLPACQSVNNGVAAVGQGFSSLWPWSDGKDQAAAATMQAGADVPCPPITIAGHMDQMHQFIDPARPDQAQLVSSVYLKAINRTCRVTGGNLAIDLDLHLAGTLGPKAKAQPTDKPSFAYPYFVAITQADGTVVAQEVYAATLSYGVNDREMTRVENLRQIIPMTEYGEPSDYRLVAGFQLMDEELAYNRSLPPSPLAAAIQTP